MRTQIRQLRDHVFTHKAIELGAGRIELMRRINRFRGVRVTEPVSDRRQMIQTCSAKSRPSRRSPNGRRSTS
jgi:hypothetical protein